MSYRRNRPRCAGFTLVEALVATLLMAIILGALSTATAQWLPNWNRGLGRLQRIDLFAAGLQRLLDDIAAAEYVSAGGINPIPVFSGGQLSITFVRSAVGPNAGVGLEMVRLAEIATERGPAMVRMAAPFFPISPDIKAEEPNFSNQVAVIRAPFRVSFAYAGGDREWREAWRDSPRLPRAVQVTIRDAASMRTLAVSTSTLVRTELPARCAVLKNMSECPLGATAGPAGSAAQQQGGGGAAGQPGSNPAGAANPMQRQPR